MKHTIKKKQKETKIADTLERLKIAIKGEEKRAQAVAEANHYRRSIWWSVFWLIFGYLFGALFGYFIGQDVATFMTTNMWVNMAVWGCVGGFFVNVYDGAIADRLYTEMTTQDSEEEIDEIITEELEKAQNSHAEEEIDDEEEIDISDIDLDENDNKKDNRAMDHEEDELK